MARPKTGTPKKGKKGDRKHGRMKRKPAYVRYLAEHRREKNAARKLAKYMRKFPNFVPDNLDEKVQLYLNKLLRNA